MSLKRTLLSQFEKPEGLLGHAAGWILATRKSNVLRNRWTVDLISPKAGDRVLEVGCGPGVGLQLCLSRVGVCATGVDHSSLMIKKASRRNAMSVRQGRLTLSCGTIDDVPSGTAPFDTVFSINVIQFVDGALFATRAATLLRPGGLLAATYQPRHARATAADATRMAARIAAVFRDSGFDDVRTEELPLKPLPAICVLGRRKRHPA